MPPAAGERVGNLIVVLQKGHETKRFEIECGLAPRLLLPSGALALKKKPMPRERYELVGGTVVIAVIGFASAGQRHLGAVVEVIVPHCIETIASALWITHKARVLCLILGYDKTDAVASGAADLARNGSDKVLR